MQEQHKEKAGSVQGDARMDESTSVEWSNGTSAVHARIS